MMHITKKSLQLCLFGCMVLLAALHAQASMPKAAEPKHLTVYMEQIIGDGSYRNFKNAQELNRVSAWIREQMRLFGIPCQYQNYKVNDEAYRNVVCSLKTAHAGKVIVGAHYDVFEQSPGADDNASGVAGVIETARLLAAEKARLKKSVDFIFYTLEEPPFSRTEDMGSYVHAKSIEKQGDNIQGIYILEMIGYFDPNFVQQYPAGLKWFYPSHGNFIAAVGNLQSRELTAGYCSAMKSLNLLQCERLISPSFVQHMDFSDHLSYWEFGLPAIMITDTGSYRNRNYHSEQDTLAGLDTGKMAQVVNGLVNTILSE